MATQQGRTINPSLYLVTLLVGSLVIASLSVLYAVRGALLQPYPGFTQLWVLPDVSKNCAVRVGIQTFEATVQNFRLTVAANGDWIATWPALSLASRQLWVRSIPLPPSTSGNVSVSVRLYRADKPNIAYREVRLLVPNVKNNENAAVQLCDGSYHYPNIRDKEGIDCCRPG
jgi:hypothetical protein